jgi:hypothetical protein
MLALAAWAQSATPGVATATAETFRISGTVSNIVDGQPLSGVEVTIAPAEQANDARQTLTGSDGGFVFDKVTRGKYSLSGSRSGFSLQAFQQHDQYSTAIAVGPGLVSEGLVFNLTPDASISGTVLDEENEPVRSGDVMLFSRNSGEEARIRFVTRNPLNGQGRFHFGHLRAGNYYVAVSAQPWYAQDSFQLPPGVREPLGTVTASDGSTENSQATPQDENPASFLDVTYPITYFPNVTDAESAVPIQLRPGEHASADIAVRAVPAIRLRIVNGTTDASVPLTALIQQHVFGTPTQIAPRNQIAVNGTITLTGIPPGHLALSVRHFTGQKWLSQDKEVDVSGDTEIDASENGTAPLVVKGLVRRPGATPIPAGTYIRFSSRESGETFGAQVNEHGEFELEQEGISAGPYSVAVLNAPNLPVRDLSGSGVRVQSRNVFFPRGGTVQLNVALSEGAGRVDGVVVSDEKAVAETMVLLVPQRSPDELTLFRRDQSDSDGTFTLREILPGKYTVVAIERGWELDWQNPSILKPYLEHGEVVEVGADKTYKVSVKMQHQDSPATSANSAIQ